MTADSYARATAGQAIESSKLDFSQVEGEKVSVTGVPFGISRVNAHRSGEALLVRAHSAGGPRPGDWGEVAADAVFVMRSGTDFVFTAEFVGETMTSLLQSYRALGVLAVHVFHRFTDGSGRRDFFTRELDVPANGRQSRRASRTTPGDGFPAALLTGDHDTSELLGTWDVLDPPAKTISTLECVPADGGVTVRAQGVGEEGPVDWGTTAGQLYSDGVYPEGPPALLATFDRGDRKVNLEIRNFMGILVVGQYIEIADGSGSPDVFIRECYAPG